MKYRTRPKEFIFLLYVCIVGERVFDIHDMLCMPDILCLLVQSRLFVKKDFLMMQLRFEFPVGLVTWHFFLDSLVFWEIRRLIPLIFTSQSNIFARFTAECAHRAV